MQCIAGHSLVQEARRISHGRSRRARPSHHPPHRRLVFADAAGSMTIRRSSAAKTRSTTDIGAITANTGRLETVRHAFTLIEISVVIATSCVILALMLPALEVAREAARTFACCNNLKQQGLATQNYHAAHQAFPGYGGERLPVYVRYGSSGLHAQLQGGWAGGSWMIQLLPYLEEAELADQLAAAAAATVLDQRMQAAARSATPPLNCPTRREATDYPLHTDYLERFGPTAARTDYAMNGGAFRTDGALLHLESPGIWMFGRRPAARHVTDGLSNSYLIGEKAMNVENYTSGRDYGDRSPVVGWTKCSGSANSYVRFAAYPPAMDRTGNCLACHGFGSAHPNGWNSAFADGSVRVLNYAIDAKIHRACASIAGGETIDGANP